MDKITATLESSLTGSAPQITVFPPAKNKCNGIGIVILPGGGYGVLAEHEGNGYAKFFSQGGAACFVLKYRLGPGGHRHPAMLEDALAGIETARKYSEKSGLGLKKIGIMGSSAGGHLAAHSLVDYGKYKSSVPLRPDFGILCYPVIDMKGKFRHQGSRDNLIGRRPSKKLIDEVSLLGRINGKTPPCFIWHTWEDPGVPVENSLLFASALRKHAVPFDLHIYEKGSHGLGLNTDFPWAQDCMRWMKTL